MSRARLRCAKWCGRGCTEAEHSAATKAAARLCARLGPKWKLHVWENLGWHYAAISPCGRFKVHPSSGGGFTAFLGAAREPGGTWTAHAKTPEAAVLAVFATARRALAPWKDLTLSSSKPLGLLR